jgi:hypothetical protein
MREETRRFYETFYQVKVSDAQLNEILATAVRKPSERTK